MKKIISSTFLTFLVGTVSASTQPFSITLANMPEHGFSSKQLLSADYGFGCAGENLSPAISWQNPPKGTKSFVLTIYDKDAPTGIGWTHWVVVNIPAESTMLSEGIRAEGGNLPQGALQTRTDFGVPGYGGACPPKGQKHRYEIKITALGIEKLPNITADATPALVGFFTKANMLGEASVTVEHGR